MRVIAGSARGRKLRSPTGIETRPTSDRVKEAIFNVLSSKIVDSIVLDVFAGTGAMGIESLSRGAKKSVFIEKRRQAWTIINENLLVTGFKSRAEVHLGDFIHILPRLENSFDIIFLDPPYDKELIKPAVSLIVNLSILNPEGIIVIETSSKQKGISELDNVSLVKKSIYGDTAVLYYQL